MKRLLARGSGNIYQISRSFRNGDYRQPAPQSRSSGSSNGTRWARATSSPSMSPRTSSTALMDQAAPGARRELSPPFRRLTMEEAFRAARGHRPGKMPGGGRPGARGGADRRIAAGSTRRGKRRFTSCSSRVVEPRLPRKKPLVLLDYPALSAHDRAQRARHALVREMGAVRGRGGDRQRLHGGNGPGPAWAHSIAHEEERKKGCRVPHETDRGSRASSLPASPTAPGSPSGSTGSRWCSMEKNRWRG